MNGATEFGTARCLFALGFLTWVAGVVAHLAHAPLVAAFLFVSATIPFLVPVLPYRWLAWTTFCRRGRACTGTDMMSDPGLWMLAELEPGDAVRATFQCSVCGTSYTRTCLVTDDEGGYVAYDVERMG